MSEQANEKDNISTTIERLTEMAINLSKTVTWLARNGQKLRDMGLASKVSGYGSQIDFDYLNRDELMAVIKAFPGKWNKNTCGDTMSYTLVTEGQPTLRAYNAELPPSCKIVEEQVLVPAQEARYETRRKIVCTPVNATIDGDLVVSN